MKSCAFIAYISLRFRVFVRITSAMHSTMKSLTGNGVLVATNNSLSAAAGGVQACTRDHIVALERAGFKLEFVGFDPTHDLLTRCLNRLDGRGYRRMIPDNLAHAVI